MQTGGATELGSLVKITNAYVTGKQQRPSSAPVKRPPAVGTGVRQPPHDPNDMTKQELVKAVTELRVSNKKKQDSTTGSSELEKVRVRVRVRIRTTGSSELEKVRVRVRVRFRTTGSSELEKVRVRVRIRIRTTGSSELEKATRLIEVSSA